MNAEELAAEAAARGDKSSYVMPSNERPFEWREGDILWLRPAPGESVADFVKRAARARGPLTGAEKIALRDVFAPVLDQPESDAA